MRILLASFAFLMCGLCILACMAVALDGYIGFGGFLPVLRVRGGISTVGGFVLLSAFPMGALFLVIGVAVMDRRK